MYDTPFSITLITEKWLIYNLLLSINYATQTPLQNANISRIYFPWMWIDQTHISKTQLHKTNQLNYKKLTPNTQRTIPLAVHQCPDRLKLYFQSIHVHIFSFLTNTILARSVNVCPELLPFDASLGEFFTFHLVFSINNSVFPLWRPVDTRCPWRCLRCSSQPIFCWTNHVLDRKHIRNGYLLVLCRWDGTRPSGFPKLLTYK